MATAKVATDYFGEKVMYAEKKTLLSADVMRNIWFLRYRYRFLFAYTLIGVASLIVEVIILRGFAGLGFLYGISGSIGLCSGIFFAYWMNVRFNFKVPVAKRNRALLYFCAISTVSASINFLFKEQLQRAGWSYEQARFAVAGSLFLIAYFFHRTYSFSDCKKVGVAIYANGVENIEGIHSRIGPFADFIHVDIVDETFRRDCSPPATYRLEAVRAYWQHKPIHVHIMSRTPSEWIDHCARYADVIIVHADIDEDVSSVLKEIRSRGLQAGICIVVGEPVAARLAYAELVDWVMLLAVTEPGHSGQPFNMHSLDYIRAINAHPERAGFKLLVDGGVNEQNIGLLQAEGVVSGSSVLNSADPARQIMRLQTSSNYERV